MTKKDKKQLPAKVYIPKGTFNFLNHITKNPPTKKNFKGTYTVQDDFNDGYSYKVWQNKNDTRYMVKTINYTLFFDNKNPKFGVAQDKNIKLLIALCEKQNYGKENKEASCEFDLAEYARYFGYTDEEIQKGGKFFEELKRTILSGMHTFLMINDGKWIWEGTIYSTKRQAKGEEAKKKWVIYFNGFIQKEIEKLLKKESKQFYTTYMKEIMDRETINRQYLHRFYSWLVYMNRSSGTTIPTKVIKLIKAIKDDKKLFNRPKACYELLMKCFIYFSENYPENLSGVVFYNNKDRSKSIEFDITGQYKNMTYKDFKSWLAAGTGLKDIREALISCKSAQRINKKKQLTEEDTQLVDRILNWVANYENVTNTKIRFNEEDRKSFIGYCLNKMGHSSLEALFEKEANKDRPNAIEFLTKVLPLKLHPEKEDKKPQWPRYEVVN